MSLAAQTTSLIAALEQLGRSSQPELDGLQDTTEQHVCSALEYRTSSCP